MGRRCFSSNACCHVLQRGQLRGALAHPRFYLLKRADVEAFAKRDRPPGRPRMATDDAK